MAAAATYGSVSNQTTTELGFMRAYATPMQFNDGTTGRAIAVLGNFEEDLSRLLNDLRRTGLLQTR